MSAGVTLLVATTNAGKIREIRLLLADLPIRLLTLDDFPSIDEPVETGTTFAANALIKARAYAAVGGVLTVAEDSGLAIDALGGRPGVESARYPGATYTEKFANLYRELAPYPRPWTARFVCSLVCVDPSRVTSAETPDVDLRFSCEATVEGEIATVPTGSNGFGYDPIFFHPPYGATLAAVDDDRKLAVAHRGKAFRLFSEWLAGVEAR